MNPSLTVVVPVCNSQSSLPRLIDELLEVVPELTSDFEIVLVDDGSTDATVEIAQELSLHFPQVQLLVHPQRLGPQEVLRSALRYSHGQMLLALRSESDFDPDELPKVWSHRMEDDAVIARYSGAAGSLGTIPQTPQRLTEKYSGKTTTVAAVPFPDLVLVPRRILVGWQQMAERPALVSYLKTRGYQTPSVIVRPRRLRRPPAALIAALEQMKVAVRQGGVVSAVSALPAAGVNATTPAIRSANQLDGAPRGERPRGPSYLLARLRAFATGE